MERTLILLGYLLILLAVVLISGGHVLDAMGFPPVPIALVLGAASLGALFWKGKPWTYLTAGIVVSLLPLMILLTSGIPALANPLTGGEFQATFALLGTLLLALPAGILGFARTRRGGVPVSPRVALRNPQGAFALAVLALLAGGLLVSGASTSAVKELAASGGGYDFVPAVSVVLDVSDHAFPTEPIKVKAGELTELVLVNHDPAFHTFTYEVGGKTYHHDLLAASTTRFLVKFDEAGTVAFWCAPHSGGAADDGTGMVGQIVVE